MEKSKYTQTKSGAGNIFCVVFAHIEKRERNMCMYREIGITLHEINANIIEVFNGEQNWAHDFELKEIGKYTAPRCLQITWQFDLMFSLAHALRKCVAVEMKAFNQQTDLVTPFEKEREEKIEIGKTCIFLFYREIETWTSNRENDWKVTRPNVIAYAACICIV